MKTMPRAPMATLFLITAVAALASPASAQREEIDNRDIVVPVFTEHSVRATAPANTFKLRLSPVDELVSIPAFGSGWLYVNNSVTYLVTAAHVVSLDPNITELVSAEEEVFAAADDFEFDIRPARIRVGGLALRPQRILVDQGLDVAILQLHPQSISHLKLRPLNPGAAAVGAETKIWGFPGIDGPAAGGLKKVPTASPTSQRCDVTAVRNGEVICSALNGIETRGGFSGGPLVAADGSVLGLVSRSTPENTRCVAIDRIDEVIRRFPSQSVPCAD